MLFVAMVDSNLLARSGNARDWSASFKKSVAATADKIGGQVLVIPMSVSQSRREIAFTPSAAL